MTTPDNTTSKNSDSQSQSVTPKKNSFHIDWFQFIIALVIVVSFTLFVGKVIWNNPTFEESFKIIAIIAPFVGTIIGFYFGQKPVQGLTQEVAKVTGEKQVIRNDLADTIINSDSLEKRLDRMEGKLASLKSIFGKE